MDMITTLIIEITKYNFFDFFSFTLDQYFPSCFWIIQYKVRHPTDNMVGNQDFNQLLIL